MSAVAPDPGGAQHSRVVSDAGGARGYFIWLTPLLSMRYIVDFAKNFIGDYVPHWMKPAAERRLKPIEDYIEGRSGDAGRAAALKYFVRAAPGRKTEELDEARERFARYAADERCIEAGESLSTKNIAEHLRREKKHENLIESLTKQVQEHQRDHFYDTTLGAASVGVTTFYARQVWGNIRNLFSETVAYDLGKRPEDVTVGDILHSDNKVVHDAVHNYINKNLERFGTDGIFFARHLARLPGLGKLESVNFGMLGIGTKAAELLLENKRHQQTTIFEDLVQLVDDKINPDHGVGHPITEADIASLYQKYALIHDPKQTAGAVGKGINWEHSEPIFKDIAERMNRTYRHRYFHTDPAAAIAAKNGAVLADGPRDIPNFGLPELLFLLGHGLIDPMNPAQTTAYVAIADKQGVPALKREMANGTAVREARPLTRVSDADTPDRVASPERSVA